MDKQTTSAPAIPYHFYNGADDEAALRVLEGEQYGQLSVWEPEGERPEMVFLHYAIGREPVQKPGREPVQKPGVERREIWGHLANSNPVLERLAARPRATFWVNGPSAYVPSHWSAAPRAVPTSYYAWAQFEVEVQLVGEPEGVREILRAMLARLQPEGSHPPLEPEDPSWQGMLAAITGLRMRITACRSRFKYGQNRPPATRRAIAGHLTGRGLPRDGQVAAAVLARLQEGVLD